MNTVFVIIHECSEYGSRILHPEFGAFTSKEDAEWALLKRGQNSGFYKPMELSIFSTERK